jgi:diadenosine tetraphosphatase ApaH/serine/threonine PP2A family protein phosphatase
VVVAGNHDFAAANKIDITTFNLYARESTLWTRDVLDSEALSFLADLPLVVELDGFSAVHGTLHSPELFDYVQCCYEASLTFSAMEQPLCFIGHSHVPIVFTERGLITYSTDTTIPIEPEVRTIINVGSVGQPRDRDPRSCYAIYDTSEQEVRILRVRYDVEAAVSKVETVGLPRALGERLRVGR